MRLPEADIAKIDRAAMLRGRSHTDFVREAAVRAAEEVLMENRLTRMSPDGFTDFLAALSAPSVPVTGIVVLATPSSPLGAGQRSEALKLGPVATRTAIRGRALLVNAVVSEAAEFWRHRGFIPSKDDPLVLFRSLHEIAVSLARARG